MEMIIASSSPVHSLRSSQFRDGPSNGEAKSCRIQRRNTISDSRSVKKGKSGRPLLSPRPTNLDSVIEQTDSFIVCSQQFEDIANKKHSPVCDIDNSHDYFLSIGKASTLPRNFSRKHPAALTGMAWKGGKQPSPSPAANESSWLETLSTKISEKKRKSGIFGSLRGRNKDKKKDNQQNDNNPRSPLLANKTKTTRTDVSSDNDATTRTTKRTALQMKPSFEFQGSTGFQSINPIDLTDSGITQPIMTSGSFRDHLPRGDDSLCIKSVSQIRKSNSLPRNILCSPVMSRKMKRPTSQWTHSEFVVDDMALCHSTSPPSSNMSSRIGSVDTLQPSINMSEEQAGVSVITPTAIDGWHTFANSRSELVHKISLTRSSSVPFEAEILSSEQSINREMVSDKKSNELSTNRFTTRSQSFNSQYHSHSIVQKTNSYEEMIMRERVLLFLLETEQSYIQSLKVLAKEYNRVLSNNGVMEDCSVKELFIAVDELCMLHQSFANKVEDRLSKWSRNVVIGDVLLDTFTSSQLRSVYGRYIQHYSKARITIESCKQLKPSLARELEECNRDNHSRLSLKDLLIKPVQRIPRYMLFVKDIIKYTSHSHSDHLMLQQGLSELRDLAECVNETERVSDRLQQHRELLTTVDGLAECLTSSSVFLRCDSVIELKGSVQRKDRLLLLFSDAVVCAAIRRKGTGFRRGSLMNINSTQVATETPRYHVKWYSQLVSLSITHSQAPLFERRRYNTLEKVLHGSQKDEALLIQMMTLSSSLHCNHHQLNSLIQEMLDQLRSGMYTRQEEIDTLPNDTARLDLVSHDSIPASKYLLVFSNQKERQHWEHSLRNAQLSSTPSLLLGSRYKTEDNDYAAAPTSSSPNNSQRQSSFKAHSPKIHSHLSIPSCRVGAELSSATVSIGQESPQIFITINDSCNRGSIAIINAVDSHLVATLPLSSSKLLCSVCIIHPTAESNNDSFSFSDSGEIPFFNGNTLQAISTPRSAASGRKQKIKIDTPFDMLRSSSAPPTSFQTITGLSSEQWLWLGSEAGIIYLLKVGVSSLHVGTSVSFNLKSAVECLLSHNNKVWVGLRDGRLVMFQLQPEISYEYYSISANSNPVTCLAPAGHMILAATGNIVVGVSSLTGEHKELLQLNPTQLIVGVAISDRLVFLSLQDSLLVLICSFVSNGSLDVLCTTDCTQPVFNMLKNYDPIVKQHKCSFPHVTTLSCTSHTLAVGTSTGIILYLPLPLVPGHVPILQSLGTGHVDKISIMALIPLDGLNYMLVTGGHGLEDLSNCRLYNNVSETEGCITVWRLPATNTSNL